MKATDLMVGDWVICNYYSDKPCYMQFGVGDFQKLGFEFCEPIPITPDILLKNGFTTNHYDDLNFAESCGDVIGIQIVGKGGVMDEMYFKYVHQLQHALRLCEIEKEIVL